MNKEVKMLASYLGWDGGCVEEIMDMENPLECKPSCAECWELFLNNLIMKEVEKNAK